MQDFSGHWQDAIRRDGYCGLFEEFFAVIRMREDGGGVEAY